jgi:hypothetical protein
MHERTHAECAVWLWSRVQVNTTASLLYPLAWLEGAEAVPMAPHAAHIACHLLGPQLQGAPQKQPRKAAHQERAVDGGDGNGHAGRAAQVGLLPREQNREADLQAAEASSPSAQLNNN